ncbi:MAG: Fe-S protein assembly co-chaperone HscB [Gammaproteobacteria bacterium]|nr:Fe-S protein assembly co-chaperone HscB [Gammaproteobacteria bacterium]
MQVDLSSNYFELFGLTPEYSIDVSLLTERRQELQKALHPDRFVGAADAERRYSMQAASMVNEAYQVLSTPLARAGYLLKLRDIDLDVETDTRMAPEFLMQQMELREAIGEVKSASDPYAAIDQIRKTLGDLAGDTETAFASAYSSDDLAAARDSVRQWQFIDKLSREVNDIEAVLDDAS